MTAPRADAAAPGLGAFMSGGARGMVAAQRALDAAGREAFVAWPETGYPPMPRVWTECRLRCPIAVEGVPLPRGGAALRVAPRIGGRATLTFGFRYLAVPWNDETGW